MSLENGHVATGDGAHDISEHAEAAGVEGHPDAPIDGPRLHELQGGNTTSLPRFLEDENLNKYLRWIPYPVRRLSRTAARWAKGPQTPVIFRIEPILPAVQQLPILLLDKYLPKRRQRSLLFIAYILIWILTFSLVKRQESGITELKPWGKPEEIGCGAYFWGKGNSCDLNGNKCRPFNGTEFAFRCPASCQSYQLSEPRAVGDQEINYRQLVIGGPVNDTDDYGAYRGDSHICVSAIHAGIISNAEGGCGVVRLVGKRSSYTRTLRHGIESVGFDSYFPQSYLFEQGVQCKARDMRWPLLVVDIVFTAVLSLFTTSPAIFFFTIFTGIFWHVGLVSDPPGHASFRDLLTIVVGKYIPVMFVAWVMYDKMGVRRTLGGLTAQIEKTILWLGACWAGALDNYTISPHIPINRLNAHDINQQPGGVLALLIIVFIIFFIVLKQIWFFRQEGRLIPYGKLYLGILGGVLFCIFLKIWDLNLRLHHYFLALVLLTGTRMQTRPALLYQGLLIGLFINGIARWGWDPILQTSYALRGDGQLGSVLPKLASTPEVQTGGPISNITFQWELPPQRNIRLDGVSLLVNDVERFRGFFDDDEVFENKTFTWLRKADTGLKEYFRFAYVSGTKSLDYSKAGIWDQGFEWEPMKPGASSIDERSVVGEVKVEL